MAYEKDHVLMGSDAIFNVGIAFSDGVQLVEDSPAILALVPAFLSAADEFKEDLPSTLMYLGSQLLERGADLRRAQKDAEPPVVP